MRRILALLATVAVLTASSTVSPTTAVPTDDENQEYPPYDLFFPRRDNATSVVVRVLDELYGSGAAYRACFADEDTLSCGTPPYRCGDATLVTGDPLRQGLLVQVLPLLIQDDLSVCGATTGRAFVVWFDATTQ